MKAKDETFQEETLQRYTNWRLSRAQLLKASVAGAALAALPGAAAAATGSPSGSAPFFSAPYFPQVTSGVYTTEQIIDILRIADTAEHLAVTILTSAVKAAPAMSLNPLIVGVLQASLAEEALHAQFLEAAVATLGFTPSAIDQPAGSGPANPLTLADSFTIPDPAIFTDPKVLFATLEAAENLFVGAYMTATREFAELGQPTLAKYAYQIGAVEAEHRALARGAQAIISPPAGVPPNNKAFETDLLLYVRDAVPILTNLGFLGGTGTPAAYPGRAVAYATAGLQPPLPGSGGAAVIQRTPNNATSSVTVPPVSNLTNERI